MERCGSGFAPGLGLDPRSVAASNLILVRSRDAAGSRFGQFAELCWPVHQEILRLIRPRLVIAYGNPPVKIDPLR